VRNQNQKMRKKAEEKKRQTNEKTFPRQLFVRMSIFPHAVQRSMANMAAIAGGSPRILPQIRPDGALSFALEFHSSAGFFACLFICCFPPLSLGMLVAQGDPERVDHLLSMSEVGSR